MNDKSDRDTVIEGVRKATAAWREDAPQPFAWPTSAASQPTLLERFVARAEAAQAFVSVAPDVAGARERVADILSGLDAPQVIVAGDAWEAPWNVARLAEAVGECTVRPTSALTDTSGAAIAKSAQVGITATVYGLADTGTVVVCSGRAGGRIESLLPAVHIALLRASDLVAGLPELFAALVRERRFEQTSAVTLVTGPSRTADIELTLTIGVHGPKHLFIVIVNDVASSARRLIPRR
jgi:L-lactate dehydrogenase complex protein LldG